MSKLIYITEAQLQEIVGNGAYLDSKDNSNEYRLGGAEISVDGSVGNYVDGDHDTGNPVTTDKIAKQIRNQRRFGGFAGYTRKPILPESNQDFTGKQNTFQISQTTLDDLKQRLNGYTGDKDAPGVKRAMELIKTGRMSYDNAYRTLDDYSKGAGNDILGDELRKELDRHLNSAENISKTGRESKMARGENVLKSNSKTGFKGGAHTPNGNNTIGITYE